jgi:hypothetical protein
VGWRGVVGYAHLLSDVNNNPQNLSYGAAVDMPTIYGFVHAMVSKKIGHTELNLVVALLSIALLVFVARRWRTGGERKGDDLIFASAVAASLLAGSHMFTHDFSPILLSLFLTAATFPSRQYPGFRAALATTMVLFWCFPVYFLFVAWHCLYLMCPILLLFSISALLASGHITRATPTEAQFVAVG